MSLIESTLIGVTLLCLHGDCLFTNGAVVSFLNNRPLTQHFNCQLRKVLCSQEKCMGPKLK